MMYPKSTFTEEQLRICADRFTIPDRYYNDSYSPQVRTAAILTSEEQRYIQQELTNARIKEIYEVYYNLTSFDAYFLVPRWPIKVVMELLDLRQADASALKRICNTLKDMDIDEYNRRVSDALQQQVVRPDYVPEKVQTKQDTSKMNEMLGKMKRYLNPKMCLKMPADIGRYIHEVPEYMVKRAWTGAQFSTQYKKMKATYQRA